jgi:hypothetical protein
MMEIGWGRRGSTRMGGGGEWAMIGVRWLNALKI